MPLPLIPIALGSAGIAAGSALHAWLTSEPLSSWESKAVFNARMRDMHGLALALNDGFSRCPAFMSNAPQLAAWRSVRDNFGEYFGDIGTKVYLSPSLPEIEQAKSYSAKFFFWTKEYERLKCGSAIGPGQGTTTKPGGLYSEGDEETAGATDWGSIIKWSVIGVGGAFFLKTANDLLKSKRGY